MKVSVVLCTYQGEHFLQEQLQSILAQTRRPDEIIVSDDASTDSTTDIAEKLLHGSGIAYEIHVNEQNLGFRQNFAQAMQRASGDILFLSDQDDVWHPEKIARMLVPFEQSETLMAFHNAVLVDSALQPLAPSFWRTMTFDPAPFQAGDYRRLLVSNVVQGSASAFRRSLLCRFLMSPSTTNGSHSSPRSAAASCPCRTYSCATGRERTMSSVLAHLLGVNALCDGFITFARNPQTRATSSIVAVIFWPHGCHVPGDQHLERRFAGMQRMAFAGSIVASPP